MSALRQHKSTATRRNEKPLGISTELRLRFFENRLKKGVIPGRRQNLRKPVFRGVAALGGKGHDRVIIQNNPINYSDPSGLKTYMCQKFLHALGGSGRRTGPDISGNPLYHQYICIKLSNGTTVCGGQDRSGGSWSPGRPSIDTYSDANCTEIEPDNECIETCMLISYNSPRPYYGLIGPGTNCQEWADSTYKSCKSKCKCNKYQNV